MLKFFVFLVLASSVYCENNGIPQTVIENNMNFGLDLYGVVITDHVGNLAQSPISLFTILSLISLGAQGDTATQIKSALKLNIPDDEMKQVLRSITEELNNASVVSIATANKLYVADGIKIEPEFLKTSVEDAKAGVENIDFASGKEAADKINSWVEKQTHEKIKELLNPNQLKAATKLVLVNTLYFQGNWLHPFYEEDTKKADFHVSKTEVIQVDTMELTETLMVHRNTAAGVTCVAFPYANTNANFLIAVPDEINGFEAAEKVIKSVATRLNFTKANLRVFVPKFKVESTIDMIPALKKLGITSLFANAELNKIAREDLVVSAVTQKVYIDVNEKGTEAASATAVVADEAAFVPKRDVQELRVNRPFMYCLVYNGLYLINGRVANPSVVSGT